MKKSYFIIAVLVVCTSLPIALTSCSSKSDDEQEDRVSPKTQLQAYLLKHTIS